MKIDTAIIIPNWNGATLLGESLKSLQNQTIKTEIIVVDNGSSDDSIEIVEKKFPKVHLIKHGQNLGFAGGVNSGIKLALKKNYEYITLFNNDAVAEQNWAEVLKTTLEKNPKVGAVAGKLLKRDGKTIDSTGDQYSSWGLPIARQRDVVANKAFARKERIFGATAGACMYRAAAIKDIGFFDEKFFAYYEDTDYNFRLQLRGWQIIYTPKTAAYHATGSTSSKMSGFTTYQTTKNLPMLFFKNVPMGLLPKMLPRFFIAYYAILFSSIVRGRGWPAIKGHIKWISNIPYVTSRRLKIQKGNKVTNKYIWSIIYNDLPPDAYKLRKLRGFFTGKL